MEFIWRWKLMMKIPNIFYLLTNQLQYLIAQPSTAWRLVFWDTFPNKISFFQSFKFFKNCSSIFLNFCEPWVDPLGSTQWQTCSFGQNPTGSSYFVEIPFLWADPFQHLLPPSKTLGPLLLPLQIQGLPPRSFIHHPLHLKSPLGNRIFPFFPPLIGTDWACPSFHPSPPNRSFTLPKIPILPLKSLYLFTL